MHTQEVAREEGQLLHVPQEGSRNGSDALPPFELHHDAAEEVEEVVVGPRGGGQVVHVVTHEQLSAAEAGSTGVESEHHRVGENHNHRHRHAL